MSLDTTLVIKGGVNMGKKYQTIKYQKYITGVVFMIAILGCSLWSCADKNDNKSSIDIKAIDVVEFYECDDLYEDIWDPEESELHYEAAWIIRGNSPSEIFIGEMVYKAIGGNDSVLDQYSQLFATYGDSTIMVWGNEFWGDDISPLSGDGSRIIKTQYDVVTHEISSFSEISSDDISLTENGTKRGNIDLNPDDQEMYYELELRNESDFKLHVDEITTMWADKKGIPVRIVGGYFVDENMTPISSIPYDSSGYIVLTTFGLWFGCSDNSIDTLYYWITVSLDSDEKKVFTNWPKGIDVSDNFH